MTIPTPLNSAPRVCDWLAFSSDNKLHVLTGRVELGQGNLTGLAQIAADELNLPIDKVQALAVDTSRAPNEGFTSGSLSISQGGMAIRLASSAACRLLLQQASHTLGCDVTELELKNFNIVHVTTGCQLPFGQLIPKINWESLVLDHASPKAADERRLVGQSVPRPDFPDRVIGTPFVHDMLLPSLQYGRILHPPCYGARLLSIDIDALAARPGVLKVAQNGDIVGVLGTSQYAVNLAIDWATRNAKWQVPEFNHDRDPIRFIRNSNESISPVFERGSLQEVLGKKLSHQISKPFLSHGSIGPSAAVSLCQGNTLKVWSHAQGPFPLRDAIATVLDMPKEDVTVQHVSGAGCYGHNGADDAAMDAAFLAHSFPDTPVKVIWSRADEFKSSPLGPGMVSEFEATTSEDGTILGLDVLVNSASHGNRPGRSGSPNLRNAAFLNPGHPPSRSNDIPLEMGGGADRNAVPLYEIPNLRVRKRIVHEIPYRTSSMRSLGAFANVYGLETLMDRLASQINDDPFSYRLRHLSDERARVVLERARQLSHQAGVLETTSSRGWGLGFAKYKNVAAYCAVVVEAFFEEAMTITNVIAVIDAGEAINPDAIINQTEGGIVQAISWGTMESIRFDGPKVQSESWIDYPILKFSQVPPISVDLIQHSGLPPLGCAEAAQGPTVAAIGNTVFSVMGRHVRDLPITTEAIMNATLSDEQFHPLKTGER
ncbi:MAG: molybdopterin cofactor-binding domain-containing protein [Bordetella sp.]